MKQSYNKDIATLEIRDVFPEDSGKFSCMAKNGTGEARTECKVYVKGEKKTMSKVVSMILKMYIL